MSCRKDVERARVGSMREVIDEPSYLSRRAEEDLANSRVRKMQKEVAEPYSI
jgi:hypothetical protein